MRTEYLAEKRNAVDDVLISIAYICEQMKPGRKKRISFELSTITIVCRCLVDWRNQKIISGEDVAVEVINEMLLLFSK